MFVKKETFIENSFRSKNKYLIEGQSERRTDNDEYRDNREFIEYSDCNRYETLTYLNYRTPSNPFPNQYILPMHRVSLCTCLNDHFVVIIYSITLIGKVHNVSLTLSNTGIYFSEKKKTNGRKNSSLI